MMQVSPLEDGTYNQLAIRDVDANNLENLSAGIDTSSYRWGDLDGEGTPVLCC